MEKFDLTNSRTAVNLAAAFVGECQTRTRYWVHQNFIGLVIEEREHKG